MKTKLSAKTSHFFERIKCFYHIGNLYHAARYIVNPLYIWFVTNIQILNHTILHKAWFLKVKAKKNWKCIMKSQSMISIFIYENPFRIPL
jgi:hypothetical protein